MGTNLTNYLETVAQQVDRTFSAARVSMRPWDVTGGGWYSQMITGTDTSVSGAGISLSFRYTGTNICLVRSILLSINTGTNVISQIYTDFSLYVARNFTASDTGGVAGTLTGNCGKYRKPYATTAVGDIRIAGTSTSISAGTRTLDTQPLTYTSVAINATGNLASNLQLLPFDSQDHPVVLANNEGLVAINDQYNNIAETLIYYVTIEWAEVTSF